MFKLQGRKVSLVYLDTSSHIRKQIQANREHVIQLNDRSEFAGKSS